MILSGKLMLEHLAEAEAAQRLETAVAAVIVSESGAALPALVHGGHDRVGERPRVQLGQQMAGVLEDRELRAGDLVAQQPRRRGRARSGPRCR